MANVKDEALLLRSAQDEWDRRRQGYIGLVHDLVQGVVIETDKLDAAGAMLQRAMADYMNLVHHIQTSRTARD